VESPDDALCRMLGDDAGRLAANVADSLRSHRGVSSDGGAESDRAGGGHSREGSVAMSETTLELDGVVPGAHHLWPQYTPDLLKSDNRGLRLSALLPARLACLSSTMLCTCTYDAEDAA
jgi:hypothetical protein